MKIKTKSKPETLADVIAAEQAHGFDEPEVGYVAETYSDAATLRGLGFSEAVVARGRSLAEAASDETPEYVVIRTEEGWSRSGRLYDGACLDSIAEQINLKNPVAHLGHISDANAATEFPDPQTTWVGAFTRSEASEAPENKGRMVKVIYAAGYNLPDAKIRMYLKTKAVRGTSWWGRATQIPIPGKGVKIEGFDLLSLDWARKLSEGMQTARVVALAREMDTKEGKTQMDGDGKDLAAVTPAEFKEANPNGYALLVSECTTESDKTIAEMQTTIDALEGDKTLLAEIRATLKLNEDANPLEKIAALVKKLGEKAKASVDDALDALLAEKVPDEDTRKLVRRLLPVAEMESKAQDATDAEAVKELVGEMVDEAFNNDEVIQTYVSEQAPPIVRRNEELKNGGKGVDFAKLGMTKSKVMV